MEIQGFDLRRPDDVCNTDGWDENNARAHFNGKHRDEIDYSDQALLEDLLWMSHEAFRYYLPGFLLESLRDTFGAIASGTLGAITNHVSGPRVDRIQFTEGEARTIDQWLDLILNQFAEEESWGFEPIIAKYRDRIWPR